MKGIRFTDIQERWINRQRDKQTDNGIDSLAKLWNRRKRTISEEVKKGDGPTVGGSLLGSRWNFKKGL